MGVMICLQSLLKSLQISFIYRTNEMRQEPYNTNRFPLSSFLVSLEPYGFRLTVSDYGRICTALSTGGKWDLTRLRNVLVALLVKDEIQRDAFLRAFYVFFDPEIETFKTHIDINKALADIKAIHEKAKPFSSPKRYTEEASKRFKSDRKTRRGKWRFFALGLCVAVFTLICVFSEHIVLPNFKKTTVTAIPQKPIVPKRNDPKPVEDSSPVVEEIEKQNMRIYPNVPYLKGITPTPIGKKDEWILYIAASGILSLIAVAFGVYLRQARKPPNDKAVEWNPDGERYFQSEKIGGDPAPRIDDETLAHLADSTGYFQNENPGKNVDIQASIKASIEKAMPEIVFFPGKQIRSVVILADTFTDSLAWNSVEKELKDGMTRLGVPVVYGKFRGVPDKFHTEDGQTIYLDDLEANRGGKLLLIFCDGKGFHKKRDRYCLESLARWPMIAWMDPQPENLWDESSTLPAEFGIPVYPASPGGLLRVFRRFLTEFSMGKDNSDNFGNRTGVPQVGNRGLSVYLENFLKEALPLAQDCAMMPTPVTLGLMDALRREFHPGLPPKCMDLITAIPETTCVVSGFRFSDAVRSVLRRGFIARGSEKYQTAVLEFLLEKVNAAEPADKESPAHLQWEWTRERIRLDLKPDKALERLSRLYKTELKRKMRSDLDRIAPSGEKETSSDSKLIPLRKLPKRKKNLLRLNALAKNFRIPKTGFDAFPKFKWSVLILMLLGVLFCSCMGIYLYTKPIDMKMNFTVDNAMPVDARLDVDANGKWINVYNEKAGSGTQWALQPDRKYRLALWSLGEQLVVDPFPPEFEKDEKSSNIDIEVSVGMTELKKPCVEINAENGFSVYRCPQFQFNYAEDIRIQSWRESMGNDAPANRLVSLGIELANDEERDEISSFGEKMLETGSIDALYHVFLMNETNMEKVFETIEKDLHPWNTGDAQLFVWATGEKSNVEITSTVMDRFGRSIQLGEIDKSYEVFDTGENRIVTEEEIMSKVENAIVKGEGPEVAIIRPVNECLLSEKDRENARTGSMEFEAGIRYLAKEVLCSSMSGFMKTVKFEKFENLITGNDLKFQPAIERIMLEEFGSRIRITLPNSPEKVDFTLKGFFEYGKDRMNPVLKLFMTHSKGGMRTFTGGVIFQRITNSVTDSERIKSENGFEEHDFRQGIQYIAKELLYQLEQDSYDPYKKTIHFARVHNYDPYYTLKVKDTVEDYMLEVFEGNFSLAKTTDISNVDYFLEAFLFHDRENKMGKVVPRFQVEVFDADTMVRVAVAKARFLHFDPRSLDPNIVWLRSPKPSETKKTIDKDEMDIEFRLDTVAEKAYSLKGIPESEEIIINLYKDIVNLIGDNERFRGELQDAYANLFQYLYKVGKQDEAKQYLKEMLPLSIENSKK